MITMRKLPSSAWGSLRLQKQQEPSAARLRVQQANQGVPEQQAAHRGLNVLQKQLDPMVSAQGCMRANALQCCSLPARGCMTARSGQSVQQASRMLTIISGLGRLYLWHLDWTCAVCWASNVPQRVPISLPSAAPTGAAYQEALLAPSWVHAELELSSCDDFQDANRQSARSHLPGSPLARSSVKHEACCVYAAHNLVVACPAAV